MLVNHNGKITMGDFYAHHQGQIIDASQIQAAYVRQNDTIYCLPAVSHLLLNMDVNSFCVPDQPHAGLFVPSSRQGAWKNDQEDIASWPSVQEENENSFGIYNQRYFFIGKKNAQINYNFAPCQSLTLSFTAQIMDVTSNWRSAFVLNGDYRAEKNPDGYWTIFGNGEKNSESGQALASNLERYHNYIFILSQSDFSVQAKFIVDGAQFTQCTFHINGDHSFSQLFLNRKTFSTAATMGNIRYKSIRLWSRALSDDEIQNVCRLDGIN